MTTGSENRFPKVILVEAAQDSDPAPTGEVHLRADSATKLLYLVDDAGLVTPWGGSGYTPGGTDVAVADGGTGASTAAAARTNLGLVIGTDVQAFDADIPTVAGSQAEMEAGTETALRSMSPLRVAQAIAALGGGGGGGDLTLISETIVAGSAAASILIAGIPATYRDLVIHILARSTTASEVEGVNMQVGAGVLDTGSNYRYHRSSQGTGDVAASSTAATSASVGMSAAANNTAGNFDMTEVIIANYADTSIWRRMLTRSSHHASDRYINHGGAAWMNTADAIARVSIALTTGNLDIGSRMAIYGRG